MWKRCASRSIPSGVVHSAIGVVDHYSRLSRRRDSGFCCWITTACLASAMHNIRESWSPYTIHTVHTVHTHTVWTMSRNTSYCGENVTMVVDYRNSSIDVVIIWPTTTPPVVLGGFSITTHAFGRVNSYTGQCRDKQTTVENWMKLSGALRWILKCSNNFRLR